MSPSSGTITGIRIQHDGLDSVYVRSDASTRLMTLGANAGIPLSLDMLNLRVGVGVTPTSKFHVLASQTVASAAGAVWDGLKFASSTASITGNTQITTADGFNFARFGAPTINCDTAGLTIDHSATVFIAGAPISGTNTPTLSDNLALWIAAGNLKIGSLAGTGSRAVVADANGVLSAP